MLAVAALQGPRVLRAPGRIGGLVQGVAIGIGVTSGCGTAPANIGVRSLVGVQPAAAIGLATDQSSIYVRNGLCAKATARGLLGCLRKTAA